MNDWRDFGESPMPLPLKAALEVFAQHGYHGASIRTIAEKAGLSVPGLYHHHKSKQELLTAVCREAMAELAAHTRDADDDSDGTAAGRFDNVIECLIRFHMLRRDQAFVASTEIRGMADDSRREHVRRRDAIQDLIQRIISQAVTEGVSDCPHPRDAARAVSSICVAIANWYRPDGELDAEEVIARQLDLARRLAGLAPGLTDPGADRRTAE